MNIPSIIARHLKSSLALPQLMTTLVKEMSSLNRLSDPDRIFPGQNLNLPVVNQNEAMRKLSQIKPANEYAPGKNRQKTLSYRTRRPLKRLVGSKAREGGFGLRFVQNQFTLKQGLTFLASPQGAP